MSSLMTNYKEPICHQADMLTKRELKVLQLMSTGMRTWEIADHLGITVNTTKSHIRNLVEKMGCSTRIQAVITGLRMGMVDLHHD